MTDDLIKRLRGEGHLWRGDRIEAVDTIKAQAAEIALLREANRFLRRGLYGLIESDDADDIEVLKTHNEGYKSALTEQLQIRQQLEADNARLREAGSKVADAAYHGEECPMNTTGAYCNCGYDDAFNAWTAALQGTSHD